MPDAPAAPAASAALAMSPVAFVPAHALPRPAAGSRASALPARPALTMVASARRRRDRAFHAAQNELDVTFAARRRAAAVAAAARAAPALAAVLEYGGSAGGVEAEEVAHRVARAPVELRDRVIAEVLAERDALEVRQARDSAVKRAAWDAEMDALSTNRSLAVVGPPSHAVDRVGGLSKTSKKNEIKEDSPRAAPGAEAEPVQVAAAKASAAASRGEPETVAADVPKRGLAEPGEEGKDDGSTNTEPADIGTEGMAESETEQPEKVVPQELVDLVESGKVKSLTVTKLRRILTANDMKTTGRKAELIARLTSFVKSN